jgi:hypothetical protein
MSIEDTTSTEDPITRAWVVPWHGPRLHGVAWVSDSLKGGLQQAQRKRLRALRSGCPV